ncbi:DUF1080 domain-containing protein [Rubripirellula amarantea]|nr:DUF1080 domain-containing protein [Rubripirellula amarantea]
MPSALGRSPSFVIAFLFLAMTCPAIAAENTDSVSDPDFAVQGEYVTDNRGMHVIARGDGDFEIVIYEGGLPGAGMSSEPPRRIDGDIDVVEQLIESMEMTRVERVSSTEGAKPPPNAIVLFDGTKESIEKNWKGGRVEDGLLCEGTTTRENFQDYRLHLEFRTPWMPKDEGQKRGNSGVYHQGRYETQVLDSFGLEGLDNETGSIYTISAPSTNVCFPPMRWQTYDVDFTAARFDETGQKTSDARLTVRLNGILVQSDVTASYATRASIMNEGPEPGPIYLQDHGNPVRFRNIWLVPRDLQAEARRPIVIGYERFYASRSEPSADAGELLISGLACSACHEHATSVDLPTQRGPDLSDVATRVRTDALVAMIADPHTAKPHTTMPDPWGTLSTDERNLRGRAIASYLSFADTKAAGQPRRPEEQKAAPEWIADGEALYHSVGCVACHQSFDGSQVNASTTVGLGDPANKYSLASLAAFLQNPDHVRKGLRMPGVAGPPLDAKKIAAYLLRDVTSILQPGQMQREVFHGVYDSLPEFHRLTAEATSQVTGFKIDDIEPKVEFVLRFRGSFDLKKSGKIQFRLSNDDQAKLIIGDDEMQNWNSRMSPMIGTFNLEAGRQDFELQYWQRGGGIGLAVEINHPDYGWTDLANVLTTSIATDAHDWTTNHQQPAPELVQQGRIWFAESGCVNCHAMSKEAFASTKKGPALADANIERGCLATDVADTLPNYELTGNQRMAIAQALRSYRDPIRETDDQRLQHLTMAALNCYACHRRGEWDGPESTRNGLFHSTVPEMGEEGRLPPTLDGVGDKLNDQYLAKVFANGANDRPYMKTRMPRYSDESLKGFQQSLVRTDRRNEVDNIEWNVSPDEIVITGRECVGSGGLSCVKCHRFGDEVGTGIGAIDMLKMPVRLRRDWFHRYLMDPTKYRPGTRMPNSFPEGISAFESAFDGDPAKQIEAMWTYLSQGESAREPIGLKAEAILLTASERPRIHRNFFSDVSNRSVAVGYPAMVNLIWDTEQMALAKVWKNSFVDASIHWVGRGQGRNRPLGDAVVSFESSSPLALLSRVDAEWPTESARDRGVKFIGYRLDSDGNPQFRYRMGDFEIVDRIVPAATLQPQDPKADQLRRPVQLARTLEVSPVGETADKLVWRIGSNNVEVIAKNHFTVAGAEVLIDGVDASVMKIGDHDEIRASVPGDAKIILSQMIAW